MKKFLAVIIVVIVIASANFAAAGGNYHHNDDNQKQSQIQFQQQNQTQNTNVSIGDISATGGTAESSANANATGGTVNIEYKSPTGAPLINPTAPPEVQLYQLSATAIEKGINTTLFYNETCKPVNSKEFPLESREEKIKKIQMVFTPHQDYLKEEKNGKTEIKEARIGLPKEKVKCLGILNVESVSKKNIPLSQIYGEAGNYILSNLKGYEKIYLVDKDSAAAARGVNNSGFGASLAPGQSWLLGQATGAIGGGLSYGNGNAFNATRLGTTFIVLGESPDGIIFKLPEPKPEVKELEKPATVEEKKVTVEVIIIQQPTESIEKKKELKEKKKPTGRHYTIPDWE